MERLWDQITFRRMISGSWKGKEGRIFESHRREEWTDVWLIRNHLKGKDEKLIRKSIRLGLKRIKFEDQVIRIPYTSCKRKKIAIKRVPLKDDTRHGIEFYLIDLKDELEQIIKSAIERKFIEAKLAGLSDMDTALLLDVSISRLSQIRNILRRRWNELHSMLM